jgi:hypothetical protein
MGNDRDARGLEDLVELFDRLFLCRSFHSKLSPLAVLARSDRRVAPIVQSKA